ncbi:MAG: NACHT domain-containing protein [Anaerolineaceae bacterium]|nr:NACHT domain-containing protein [Anaerolineaceae bacterium]
MLNENSQLIKKSPINGSNFGPNSSRNVQIDGDVEDSNIITGDGNTFAQDHSNVLGRNAQQVNNSQINGNLYGPGAQHIEQCFSDTVSPKREQQLQKDYLNQLLSECNDVSLLGITNQDDQDLRSSNLQLSSIYTELDTVAPEHNEEKENNSRQFVKQPQDQKRLSALTQLNRNQKLVILGDPGSGKSTFVNYIALCMAGELLENETINLNLMRQRQIDNKEKALHEWDHEPLLPILVTLRDYAVRGLPQKDEKITPQTLTDFIMKELEGKVPEDFCSILEKKLTDGECILFFDGLDEVLNAESKRVQIKQSLERFAGKYPDCRYLVTSRTYAYQKQDWKINGFEETKLALFNDPQINFFIDHWYEAIGIAQKLDQDTRQSHARSLKQAVQNRSGLKELAERPLLLTLMASLHASRNGKLPDNREELYKETVDLLLDRWQRRLIKNDEVKEPSIIDYLKVEKDDLRKVLSEVAFEVHKEQKEDRDTADIDEDKLVAALIEISESKEVNPLQLKDYLSNRAGLLLPRGNGIYAFPHRSIQEYLAACWLANHEDYPKPIVSLACEQPNR